MPVVSSFDLIKSTLAALALAPGIALSMAFKAKYLAPVKLVS